MKIYDFCRFKDGFRSRGEITIEGPYVDLDERGRLRRLYRQLRQAGVEPRLARHAIAETLFVAQLAANHGGSIRWRFPTEEGE